MKTDGGVDIYTHVFLTSSLPWEGTPGARWIGGWVGPRVGME
jgi:hypothetical protein